MAKTKIRWTLERFESLLLSKVACEWGGLRPPKYTVEYEKDTDKFHIMMGLPQMQGVTVSKKELGNHPSELLDRCVQRMCLGWKQRATELIGQYPDKEWYEHVSTIIKIMNGLKKKRKRK